MTDAYRGVPLDAPPLPGPVVFTQDWLELAFLHWPVDPADVAPFFPPGVEPDVWDDGATFVGLVPFRMRRAGFGRRPPVPFFGSFLEWNVRLYSVDGAGRRGVVFRSLDATRLAVVALARAGGVPYRYAHVAADRSADVVTWRLTRRGRHPVSSTMILRIGAQTELTPLEVFLTSRWGMHSRLGHRALWVPNRHGPWPVRNAQLLELYDQLVAAAGITPIGPMLRPLWTPGVHAQFSTPQLVGLA